LQVRAGRPAFLKKGSKKRLIILASACPERLSHVLQKFFGSFFQKRTAFCPVGFARGFNGPPTGAVTSFLKQSNKRLLRT
jgi:hypothetical protein